MAKLSLNKLGLSKKQEVKTIQVGESSVEVLQYLDIATKSSLVNAAVRGAVISGIVDEILLDAYLHLFILEEYTNIALTPKQRENLLETFDILESNGIFDIIIGEMAQSEYEYIFAMAKKLMNNLNEYNRNIMSILQNNEEVLQRLIGQTK